MKSLIDRFQNKTLTGCQNLIKDNDISYRWSTWRNRANRYSVTYDHASASILESMKKSLRRMVKMPHLTGAFGRQCRTDDDKVRLLSVVSRSSLSDDAPILVDEATGSDLDEALLIRSRIDERPSGNGPCFSGINSAESGQLIDVTDTKVVRGAQKGDDEQRHEWVFTLYDFDGKGTPNKEDILSIVRAIYDVLGSAKIRARSATNSVNDETGDRQTFGAFKIKLSLTADENADVAVTVARKNEECRVAERRRFRRHEKMTVSGVGGKITSAVKLPPPPSNEAGSSSALGVSSGDARHSINSDRARYEEELPLLRHHKKPAKRRGGCVGGGVERHSPPPLHSRKIYRRSASFSQNGADPAFVSAQHEPPPEPVCASCTYRDYVNLSELENCCGGGHHDQQRHSRGGIHHIRHCDRHCHCPASELSPRTSLDNGAGCYRFDGKAALRNGFCFLHPSPTTAVVRRCADWGQQSISPRCCRLLDPISNYGAAPSTTSMHVNVQARAYYQDRTAVQARTPSCDKENAQPPPASVPVPPRKQRGRDRENVTSAEQVRSWVLNESSTQDPSLPGKAEQRGVADGSDRMFVEHKHVHKHNHYHHYIY